jgi:hypothetical protein
MLIRLLTSVCNAPIGMVGCIYRCRGGRVVEAADKKKTTRPGMGLPGVGANATELQGLGLDRRTCPWRSGSFTFCLFTCQVLHALAVASSCNRPPSITQPKIPPHHCHSHSPRYPLAAPHPPPPAPGAGRAVPQRPPRPCPPGQGLPEHGRSSAGRDARPNDARRGTVDKEKRGGRVRRGQRVALLPSGRRRSWKQIQPTSAAGGGSDRRRPLPQEAGEPTESHA